MNRISQRLFNAHQAWTFIANVVWPTIKPVLIAGRTLRIIVQEDTRSLDQNAKFHALCGDVAASGFPWMGQPRSDKEWKVLFVSGHAIATGEGADVVYGLEGECVNLRESTALMSVRRSSSLIEYALAFIATNGISIRHQEPVTC